MYVIKYLYVRLHNYQVNILVSATFLALGVLIIESYISQFGLGGFIQKSDNKVFISTYEKDYSTALGNKLDTNLLTLGT